jgi:hypothetical protein
MSGWPAVALMILGQIGAAAWLIRLAARRWRDYLVIAVLTAALVRPTVQHVTGDVSRYLPDVIWSGADDKEQIILASAASTILLPLIVSALAVYVCTQAVRALRPGDRG